MTAEDQPMPRLLARDQEQPKERFRRLH